MTDGRGGGGVPPVHVALLSWASAVRRNYGCWPPVAKTPAFA